ncbi:iron chaperone [Paucilactobacillus kaifaensis]|uniref:iron chaperone n=1 Tax=Paucilactobacillus kaifaensis TaxID=2559921 RepID=UPI0010FA0086|nr:iron chaperone [Paucilactobacillus kaifaensis]
MNTFQEFIDKIEDPENKARAIEVLQWVLDTFPSLKPRLAWNQPMFTDHGTFIIGFSVSKKHMAATPEEAGIAHFVKEIEAAGIDHTKGIIRMPWNQPVNYDILKKMIQFNIDDKAGHDKFWR